jgi:hypothetical protein
VPLSARQIINGGAVMSLSNKSHSFKKNISANNFIIKFSFISALVILIIILISCVTIPENQATLILSIDSTFQEKLIIPDDDMIPATYDVMGIGPRGANFSFKNVKPPIMASNLEPGVWYITVNAKNESGTIIATGEQFINLFPGQSQTVIMTVIPIEGFGAIDITMNWSPDDTWDPSVAAQLIPDTGAPIDLDFVMDTEGIATYTGSDIPSGYHTLIVQLLDGGELTLGAVEVVRVLQGQTTTGTFDFYDINLAEASIQVNITPVMDDPIDVTMNSQIEEFGVGGFMTVEAEVPPDTGNVTYVWYINGNALATGVSFTTPSELPVGVYRLDVVAFTADGSRAGSTTYKFNVLNLSPVDVTFIWDPNEETDLAGYNFYWGYEIRDYMFTNDAGNQTTYTVTGLIPGLTYHFAVTAYNTQDLESDYSDEVVYTIPIN